MVHRANIYLENPRMNAWLKGHNSQQSGHMGKKNQNELMF